MTLSCFALRSLFNRPILFFAQAMLAAVIFFTLPVGARGQDATAQPDVANSKFQFSGTINSNSVYVRSGPADSYYPTMKLDKGAPITVVGIKFDWLKISPPEGSFCYVAKVFVEKHGDGSVGRVTKPDLNVRAGSNLNAMKAMILTKLNEGDSVQILGAEDEYFKIKPPAGTYLFVHKQFVDPVKSLGPVADAAGVDTAARDDAPARTQTPSVTDRSIDTPIAEVMAEVPATQPDEATAVASTQPTPLAQAEADYERLETQFADASRGNLEDQPLPEMIQSYEHLIRGGLLPASMQAMAQQRLVALKIRNEARAELLAANKTHDEAQQRQLAMQAERNELTARIKAGEMKVFSAVGTLRTSSLQLGNETLYRLTDPNTGRTLVYIRTANEKALPMLDKFVGVNGVIQHDRPLSAKVIIPTDFTPVDQDKVGASITATLIPPSLMPRGTQASTDGN